MHWVVSLAWWGLGVFVSTIILVLALETQQRYHEWLWDEDQLRLPPLDPLPPPESAEQGLEEQFWELERQRKADKLMEQRRRRARLSVRTLRSIRDHPGICPNGGAFYPPPPTPDEGWMFVNRPAGSMDRRQSSP